MENEYKEAMEAYYLDLANYDAKVDNYRKRNKKLLAKITELEKEIEQLKDKIIEVIFFDKYLNMLYIVPMPIINLSCIINIHETGVEDEFIGFL